MKNSIQFKYIQAFIFLVSCSTSLSCHGTIKASGITANEKKTILQEHNKLRQLVATGDFPGQPAAENMQEIIWDDELALRAQEWANNCEFRHDPNRKMTTAIWTTWQSAFNPRKATSSWHQRSCRRMRKTYQQKWSATLWIIPQHEGHLWFWDVTPLPTTLNGEVKISTKGLVWGETNLIGCGYSEYKDRSKYNKLYVCNYGPGGNVVGFNPYQIGNPSCKNHGMDPSPRYRGLCINPTLIPSGGAFFNKIETYEYKQNIFKTKTSYTSLRFNNQQPQQAKIQLQLSKQPTTVPALIPPFFQEEPIQSKTISSSSQPQQETENHLSFIKSRFSEKSLLRAILNPNTQPTEERTSQFLVQEHQNQQQQYQQQLQDEILNINPIEIMSGSPRANWSLLSWRD